MPTDDATDPSPWKGLKYIGDLPTWNKYFGYDWTEIGFFPATSYRLSSQVASLQGTAGHYWSATKNRSLWFDSVRIVGSWWTTITITAGMSVRCVKK